jgi:anti-sigma B factor antagonist
MTPGRAQELVVQRRDERDGSCTFALDGELDLASAPALQETIERACEEDATSAITLDLSKLGFIDSTGLAAIVYVSRVCEQRGCELAMIRGPEAVQRVFDLTGLAETLPFVSNGDDTARA